MKNSTFLFLAILLLYIPIHSKAWGEEGHKMIASIAYQIMDKSVRDSVDKYLNGVTIEDASLWMDEVRKDHTYDYLKPMHYINIEEGLEYVVTEDDNIINELNKVIAQLQVPNRLNVDVTNDLKILLHLLGDLHQPLHDGYALDKGGNKTQVSFFGHNTNLHKVWDTEIITHSNISKEDCLKLIHNYSHRKLTQLLKPDVVKWMKESRSYLPSVYGFTDNKLSEEYLEKSVPIVEQQILLGGLRLATVLNQIFKKQ